jgi:hypothetical protein
MKKKIINTCNREIYEKMSMLHFLPEVMLKDVEKFQIERIVRKINSDCENIDMVVIGNYIVLRKLNPFNFDIYFRG